MGSYFCHTETFILYIELNRKPNSKQTYFKKKKVLIKNQGSYSAE